MATFTVTFDDQTGDVVGVQPPAGKQEQLRGPLMAQETPLQNVTGITNISLIHKQTPSGTVCCVMQGGREWCWC